MLGKRIRFAQFDRWTLYGVFIVIVVAMCFVSWYVYSSTKQKLAESMRQRVATLAVALDPEPLIVLRGFEEDANTPEYNSLKVKLMNLREINQDIRFIYLMVKREEGVFFVGDSEPPGSEDESPPGQQYEEVTDSLLSVFESGEVSLSGAEKDRWGTWVSAIAPIYEDSGSIGWVVGIDMDARRFVTEPIFFASIPAAVFFVICILMAVAITIHNKELRLMTIRNQFISLASHELRSPLTGIRWSSEALMQDEKLVNTDREIAENIYSACTKLLSIINELLDAASLESKKFDRRTLKPVELKTIAHETISHLALFAKEKKITIESNIITDPCMVLGDPSKLFNVISNILSNAIKYSNPHAKVMMTTMRDATNVYLFVQDGGIGIPEHDITRVSRGYYRAPNAVAHTTSGTGLGLFVSKQTVQRYNGELYIHSIVGKGTTVTVSLPAYVAQK